MRSVSIVVPLPCCDFDPCLRQRREQCFVEAFDDITRQQIYAWRSELKKKGLLSASSNALFIPVDVKAVRTDLGDDPERCSGMVELRLSCGRTLRFGSAFDTAALTQIIRAVEAA